MEGIGQSRRVDREEHQGGLIHQLPFDPADPKAALAQLPRAAGVFALYGAEAHAEPYIGRTPNLRGRLERLLQPSEKHPRRLQLAGRVRRICWRHTGSEFESLLVQFDLLENQYGPKALDRMHLRAPAFVRYLGSNAYPRLTVTHRPSLREADWAYGPFASRAAAERYVDEVLKLFLLRRCTEDLEPDPSHPGCVYSEMKMCLAPCYRGCSDERYAEEAAAVQDFLATRGEGRLTVLRGEREKAVEVLAFETAAAIHGQVQRVEAARALAPDLVRPMSQLRAVILQASSERGEVAMFLFEYGSLRGPAAFTTMGMRIQNEQSGSSSLFAHPIVLEAVAEQQGSGIKEQGSANVAAVDSEQGDKRAGAAVPKAARGVLEERLAGVLAELAAANGVASAAVRQGHLALLKRWYYRPETQRVGEVFFPDAEGGWPVKSILRGVGRVAARMFAPEAAATDGPGDRTT